MDLEAYSNQNEGERAIRSPPFTDHGPSSRGGDVNETMGGVDQSPAGSKQPSMQAQLTRVPDGLRGRSRG